MLVLSRNKASGLKSAIRLWSRWSAYPAIKSDLESRRHAIWWCCEELDPTSAIGRDSKMAEATATAVVEG